MKEQKNDAYPRTRTIPGLFQEQVEKTPDNIALVALDVKDTNRAVPPGTVHLTYRELNRKANRLAHYLIRQGVKTNEFVGIMVNRSMEMLIGIIAILKAGCAYIPLNPGAPPARTKFILEECAITRILTLSGLDLHLGKDKYNYIFIEESQNYAGNPDTNPDINPDTNQKYRTHPEHYAYTIFTSGSTGKPKGVLIRHSNLSPLLHWGYEQLALNSAPADRTLQNLAYYFDWSVWEIFITLTSGAVLYIVSDDVLLDPQRCVTFIQQHAITVLHATPTQYRHLLSIDPNLGVLRYLCIGAEKFTFDLLKRSEDSVAAHCRIFNMYGPTEATIIAAVLEVPRGEIREQQGDEGPASVPIGYAVGNTRLLILDEGFKPTPVNRTGELFISGDGLSPGYLNNPELTAERFIPIPFNNETSHKSHKANTAHRTYMSYKFNTIYKTGDLANRQPDGSIEYLGRIDFQVKIRGQRIELGEIENHIALHPDVKEALVTARENRAGEHDLCAYIVLRPGRGEATNMSRILRTHLSESLPDYMIPAFFMQIDKIPLNPNGKVDLNALPTPAINQARQSYSPPEDEIEKKLVSIWSHLLGIEEQTIGIDDNFLELGGHSLKAAQMAARIHETFDVRTTLAEIFAAPVIRKLAAQIKKAGKSTYISITASEKQEYYPLSPAQARFFFLQELDPRSTAYNLSDVFITTEPVEAESLETSFRQLIQRHDGLRTAFVTVGRRPVQKIHEIVPFEIDNFKATDGNTGITYAIETFIRPFDLSRAPLLRIGLVQLPGQEKLLLFDMHHIISDLLSMEIFVKEFMLIREGKQETLVPLKLQYKDYSQWQNRLLASGEVKKQEEYWLNEFAAEKGHPELNIPKDYERPAIQSFEGDILQFEIPAAEAIRLREYAQDQETTMFVVLLTLFYIFLARLSGQEDIVIGTPVAGRRYSDLDAIIGVFINTLALRCHPTREKTFHEFLKEVKNKTLEAFDNQDYQFEDLVKNLGGKRQKDNRQNPIYNVLYTYRWQKGNIFGAAAAGLKRYEWKQRQSMLDLSLIASEIENRPEVYITFTYCTKLFQKKTMEQFANHFREIVSRVVHEKEVLLKEIKISHDLGKADKIIPQIEFGF